MSDCGGGDCGGGYDGGYDGGWSTIIFANSTNGYNYKPRRTRAEKLADERIKREHKARKLEAKVAKRQAKAMEKALKKAEYERTKPPTLKSEPKVKPIKTDIHMFNGGIVIIEKSPKGRKRRCVIS